MRRSLLLLFLLLPGACPGGGGQPVEPEPPPAAADAAPPPAPIVISVIGTSDLHGQLRALPYLAGYVDNLRRARERTGGGVVLVDAGDMFQGTLESNLDEGTTVIAAYRAMGYHAAAVGNHEFDFGPPGPAVVARAAGDDPRGALRARGLEAGFPLLMANVAEPGGRPPGWPGFEESVIREVAGIRIGIIGVTTMNTPTTTMPANFAGLKMLPIPEVVVAEAAELRGQGAAVIVLAAHAGADCRDFDDPTDLSSCRGDAEIFDAARALPPGTVDVIIAGHTHAGVAHEVAGVPIIESYARGFAFGRVDLTVTPGSGSQPARVTARRIFPPRAVCAAEPPAPCEPGSYEGAPVLPGPAVAAVIEPAYVRARAKRDEQLGVRLEARIKRAHKEESALGNLFADLMRKVRPADVAITNGGGLRSDLPAGPLTYGALYESTPFDNRFAFVTLTGAELKRLIDANLAASTGIVSLSGIRVKAQCHGKGEGLRVEIVRDGGKPVKDGDTLKVVTSDFLASGGDGLFPAIDVPADRFQVEDGEPIREIMADQLRRQGGVISPGMLFDPSKPRLAFPGQKPVRCK